MRQTGETWESHVSVVVTGVVLIVLIALVKWPSGWSGFVCLVPVVLASLWASASLNRWYLSAGGVVAILLSAIFNSVPWKPEAAMVLLIVSVVGLLQTHQIRQELQRQETQQQTQQREQREWRMFFEHSPAAILIADGEGKIVMANPAAHTLLGFEDRPLTGEGIGPCLPALATALRLERASQVCHALTECKGWRPSGEMFLADIWFSLGDTEVGPRLGAVIVDAAERMQDRERLGFRSAMATSQIAMGAVLHEIRNVCATASLMHANLERVPSLHDNADFKALGNLIRALAKIAAAELRPGEGSLASVDLGALLDQLRLIIEPWFRESEMSVEWKIGEDLPAVWAEAPGLLQIFLNLVQNSHKAMSLSERKHLTVSAGVTGDLVIVRIQDTGPGITAPAELFQPFHRSTGLKGLGLYVSRAIAHSFSGELKYEPTPAGSCFAVELLPLRTWQKVTVEHGNRTSRRQNSAC